MPRIRLDKLLQKRQIAKDSDHARNLIENNKVLVNGSIQTSWNSFVDAGSSVEISKEKQKYVSRGGLKLEKALETFEIDVRNLRCLDVGSSTGGFTDCLLQNGAQHVVCVDVGSGQLELSIREDPRVTVLERTNAKVITPDLIGGLCDLAVMDVSFTSTLPIILPVSQCLVPEDIRVVVLIKPQFEVDQKYIDAKGIVRLTKAHKDAINKVKNGLPKTLEMVALEKSPITGAKGNVEYLAYIKSSANGQTAIDEPRIDQVIDA